MEEAKILLVLGLLTVVSLVSAKQPNIVFILTDDQDVVIGGTKPIAKTRKLVGDAGATFNNMFVTSPLCCPSRSSILTGNYVHNHGALNNSVAGNCSSPAWQATSEKETFVTHLKEQGYSTFFAGKYLNQYGFPKTGGVEHIPPGWDDWNGLVGNSRYYDFTLSTNGKAEKHGSKYPEDYLTEIIGNRAEKFLKSRTILNEPFFMMLATPAAHAPFTPAPQYSKNFSDVKAPTDGSYGKPGTDKHWLIRNAKNPMDNESLTYIHETYQNRWRTLLTVDDIVENLVNILTEKKLIDDTYVVYSSDNGFHLGQFNLPNDKRQLYDFDIRVPLMIRGPGIKAGQVKDDIILNIDFAPTFIEMAGKTPPSTMDGTSFKALLDSPKPKADKWREYFMVEHSGEYNVGAQGCPQYKNSEVYECIPSCVCEDAINNTYSCVRTFSATTNMVYCEFSDAEDFVEVYDLKKDPHQLSNIAKTIDPKILVDQNKKLVTLSICKGPTCKEVDPYPPFHSASWNDAKTKVLEEQEDTVLRFEKYGN